MRGAAAAEGQPEGIVTDPGSLRALDASLMIICKDIAAKLDALYPGWLWAVQPDKLGGVINIFSLKLSGKYGYRLHTKRVQHDPNRRAAMRAGGEILDRFGMPRGRYDYQRWQSAPRTMGAPAMDVSDRPRAEQRRYRDQAFTDAVRTGKLHLKVVDRPTATGTHRQIYVQPSALWSR